MNYFEEIRILLKEKSGKKLAAVSLTVFLIITAIVFFAAFRLCEIECLEQIDGYLGEIPSIIESRSIELDMSSRVYEDDIRTGEELGMKLSGKEEDPAKAEGSVKEDGAVSCDWSVVFESVLPGEDIIAFARTGDGLTSYPADGFTDDQIPQLSEELTKAFQNSGGRVITLLGRRYLTSQKTFAREGADILLAVPLGKVLGNGMYIAAAISAGIGWGMLLLQLYVLRRLQRKKNDKDKDEISLEWVSSATRPGILAVLAFTVLFSGMLLLLEIRTNATAAAMNQRMGVQHEIDLNKARESEVRSKFADQYRTRTQLLADYLMEHPDRQTRKGLGELSRIAKADYLMRFDSNGKELISSNSYTGFSVDANLSEEYQAVKLGYPYAVSGPAADPYTGRMQFGTAVLMTDGKGGPDGFLLAVYSADDLAAELRRMSYENTVSSFVVQDGHIAAVINDEDGCFTAHTDPEMIGQSAGDLLKTVEPGSSFEGVAHYNGEPVCVSASPADGKTLVFMVPERADPRVQTYCILAALAVMLILVLYYHPAAGMLIARIQDESRDKIRLHTGEGKAMRVFSDGYSVFLTVFVAVALTASYNGWWTSFDYVFSGDWSRGFNVFSIWAALFIVSVTLCFEFVVRTVLDHLESRLSLQARTATRLVKSLIAYAVGIFFAFYILNMFGVNTTALLASAGVISIAVGLGAQSMAADILAGFFIILEDSIHVGDYASAGGVTGKVTDMGIRTIEITDDEGDVVILNNSKVSPVRNMSRRKSQPKQEKEPEKGTAGKEKNKAEK